MQTIASNVGFRDPAENGRRAACYRRLLAVAADRAATALLLPGGFWTVDGPGDVGPLADRLVSEAGRAGLLVIGGIDVNGHGAKGKTAKADSPVALPYFGFAGGKPIARRLWQQTSSTGTNAWAVPDDQVPGADRVVNAGEGTMGRV